MADQWYYWHDTEVLGPFTGNQLADLAAVGTILWTDLVWKEGVERGVPAGDVRNLFASGPQLAEAVTVLAPPDAPPAAAPCAVDRLPRRAKRSGARAGDVAVAVVHPAG